MEIIESLGQSELGKYLVTFIVSMLPVVELRGAIPIGVGLGLNHWVSMLVGVVGSMVPVPFIILFVRRVFQWIKDKLPRFKARVERLEAKAEGKWEKYRKYELLGLFIFVAIPLPGTGAWTGALIAALMDIRMKDAFPAILGGVIVAGLLITGLTYGFTAAIS